MAGAMQVRERINQKRRTREALVQAARRLLADGQRPSVADVADEALVSRATAYRYFPTVEFLLIEAALDPATALEGVAPRPDDVRPAGPQVDDLVGKLQRAVIDHEAAYRSLLRLSLGASASEDYELLRAGLRVQWFRTALRPLREQLTRRRVDKLVAALSLCVGIEAIVTLRDICGISERDAVSVSRWAAQALVAAAIREQREADLRR